MKDSPRGQGSDAPSGRLSPLRQANFMNETIAEVADPVPPTTAARAAKPMFSYDPGSPQPPEASSEALEILARIRGTKALDELAHAQKVLAGEIRFRHRRMAAGEIREHLPVYHDLVARIRVYAGRQQA